MDMVDRLPGLRAGVEDHSVAGVGDALGDRHRDGVRHQLPQQARLGRAQFREIRVVLSRDDQHVDRRLRVYVSKRDDTGIRRDDRRRCLAGRNTAEHAIRHRGILTVGPPAGAFTDMVALLRTREQPPLLQCLASYRLVRRSGTGSCARAREVAGMGCGGNGSDLEARSRDPLSQRSGMTASEPADVVTRPTDVTETLVAPVPLVSIPAAVDADQAVTELYHTHYRSLVRLAALLVRDLGTAEEVVQEAFIAMHGGWHRLRENEKALAYLRQSVVNRSRSVLRHRLVVDRNVPKPPPDMPSAEHGAIALFERSAVIAALRALPARQREALVLRFYGDMSEAQIAEAMRISRGAVKSHTARAIQALRAVLERDT